MKNFKRLISVLLVLSVFACITPVSAGVKGDMNGDGKLLISDARVVLKIAAGQKTPTTSQKTSADMDGDGKITVKDAQAVLKLCADLEPEDYLGKVAQITPYKKQSSSLKAKFCKVTSYCGETLPDTYTADKSNPFFTPLPQGTFDYVTSGPVRDAESGKDFYYLKSGRRVYGHEVTVFTGYEMPYNKIELKNTVKYDDTSTSVYLALDWRVPFLASVKPQEYVTGYNDRPYNIKDGKFTGSYMDITFYYTTSALGNISFPESDVIKNCVWFKNADSNTATLRIYFRNAGDFYGYTAYYNENNYLVISFKEPVTTLKGRVIEIDPGHGGNQPGAGSGTGVYEKDITYKIALQLKSYLEKAGATVVFSRDNSSSVPEIEERRLNTIEKNPDLLISIHLDAASAKSVSGSSVYYYKSYSGPLAYAISTSLPTAVKGGTGHSMPNRGAHFYPFCVTRVENCPAVLVECGFITNSGDFKMQNSASGQKYIAKGIYDGIVKYMTA